MWTEVPPSNSNKKVKEKNSVVVKEGKRDLINEAFRVLRTNVEFMSGEEKHSQILVVSSFNPGSGKTFLTMNLAASLSIKGNEYWLLTETCGVEVRQPMSVHRKQV